MDKQKVDSIIVRYLKKIYGFSISKCISYDEAEDLCSDIVAEVYRSLLAADVIYNIDGYIWRISMHVLAKFIALKKKHQGISIDGMDIPVYDDFLDNDDESLIRIRREITFLTKVRREIVYSYYYENKSIAYIAQERNIPIGTVKWHLSKAKYELKEGYIMERKIGKLGLKPIKVESDYIGHSGAPGSNGGPEFYLSDTLNLNIVYSVYFAPKTIEEIAEELGVSRVFIEDRIEMLESNGFLVKQAKNRYTTYVYFSSEEYSLEERENRLKKKYEVAKLLCGSYVQSVRDAIADYTDVFIPSGNRELFEAAAVYFGVSSKCSISCGKDMQKYTIRTTDGGYYTAHVELESKQIDPDYISEVDFGDLTSCGLMTRVSDRYPVISYSIDTKYCTRKGFWENNLTSDYEYLYEIMTDKISDDAVNANKFKRLRDRGFITDDNKINIMVVKGKAEDFFNKLPALDDETKKQFAQYAIEAAEVEARRYPPQMHDMIINMIAENFVGNSVGVMVMDILYGNGTFRTLTENERITSQLIMFSDRLPG